MRRKPAMRRAAGAFTLIEILIALMVLSVGMASVLAVFVAGVRASQEVVDESAAALSAKAVMVRVLTEEEEIDDRPVRLFLKKIVDAREAGYRFVWIHDEPCFDNTNVPPAVPVAGGSLYSWRCRASSYRTDPKDPVEDLTVKGRKVELREGRITEEQFENPDSDELWRLAIEIYRTYKPGAEPIATFQTFVCTAHM
jgi:prepilin-type N-terminal cleavage/methylation domain-containing protein